MAWVVVSMGTVVAVGRTRFAFILPVGLHVCAATLLIKVKKIIIPSRIILRVLVILIAPSFCVFTEVPIQTCRAG
jgi:hypothetical protein